VDTTIEWGLIQGRPITFPMEVRAFNSLTMGFTVPVEPAAALLPGSAFEPVEVGDGATQLIVAICDYRDNPWGDYNEVNLGFLARPVGAAADVLGSFVYRMPVDQDFTCEAGNEVMGFPKVVERIDARYTQDEVTFRLWTASSVAFSVVAPRVRADAPPDRIETVSYSYLHGTPCATPLAMDLATGAIDPGAIRLEVGDGPVADELRSLGLPKAPDFCSYGEGLSATFQLGTPV
jgi:hypothetical protein